MSLLKRKIDELERTLFRAQRTATTLAAGAGWQESLMSDIRRLGALERGSDSVAAYNRVAWRFLAAACAVALVFFIFAYTNGVVDHQELATNLLQDPFIAYVP
jgi:hypothetical protein